MGLFGFRNKQVESSTGYEDKTTNKSFISDAEGNAYANGGNKPTDTRNFQAYVEASSRLDAIIRTTASVASSAKFVYGKEDAKGNFKKAKFSQTDGLYMNDYQTESDWLFELFGTLLTYDKVLLIPEVSKYKNRKGMIDWTIVPDDRFTAVVGKNQTIDSFTYSSTSGIETSFKYEDCIYITRNLTATNLIYAIPRLRALMTSIENVLGIHNFIGEYVASGGKSSIIAASDSLLSEEQAREVKRKFNEFLGTNKPKAIILPAEKFNLSKVSDSLTTGGVLEIMTSLSNEITKSFNMPLYLLGEYSSSSQGMTVLYANRTWFQIQVQPLFNTISAAFTRHFRDTFGVKNAKVDFDFSSIQLLQDDDTVKQELSEKNMKMGIFSLNEARTYQGFERLDVEAADMHLSPAYLLGQNPITFENFAEDVARNVTGTTDTSTTDTGTNPSDGIPNGDGSSNNSPDQNGRA